MMRGLGSCRDSIVGPDEEPFRSSEGAMVLFQSLRIHYCLLTVIGNMNT
jgi:hypothetical protein